MVLQRREPGVANCVDGERIADSTFIRWHLENEYDVDFERGLSVEQRAIGWMVEDHLYWALVDVRWSDDANFAKGPRNFSKKSLPPCVRS